MNNPADAFQALNDFTRNLVENITKAAFPPLHALPVALARQSYSKAVSISEVPRVEVPRVEDLSIPTRDGHQLAARLWAPSTDAGLPVMLYLHGGGFVIGGIDTCEAMCRAVAQQSGAAVVAIDYRLAPEHPFPKPLEDTWDALQWLARSAASLGLDATRLAVGGDSAGGTLAASVALLARDAGLPLRLQALFYPSVQTREVTLSRQQFGSGLVLDESMMRWFESHSVPKEHANTWQREPLHAASHVGVAPAWIGIAQCDPLADDGRLYADALKKAKVPVQLVEFAGTVHDFINMGRFLPQAAEAHTAVALALKQAFQGKTAAR